MVTCESGDEVGRRVAVGDHLGTVRYVGPIPSAKGTWLGIEWDDPSRGKHNGTYNGHSYFKTRHPTSGSFIHIEKADFGRSFVSALKERYGSNQLTLTVEELQDLQRAMNAPHLEMVGFDKINEKQSQLEEAVKDLNVATQTSDKDWRRFYSQVFMMSLPTINQYKINQLICFSDLNVISLHNLQVSCAGEDLASMCLKVQELDLSHNLFTSWDEVAKIIVNMSNVHFLNLSSNKLIVPENPETLCDAYKNISHLVLRHMDYSWEEILTCSKMWPEIQQLQVPFNNITCLNLPENMLTNLTHLDLEGNPIPDWEEINKLGMLEKLESLNLCDLGLVNIKLPSSQDVFKNLQCLLLSDNKIAKWEYISQLGKLPKLQELRFSNNPVLENLSIEAMYSKIISRIGSLEVLNRKIITRDERRGAELDYIKEYEDVWLASLQNEVINTQFLLHHPRFPELIKVYGLGEPESKISNPSLNSLVVKVRLCSPNKTIIKTLPKSITINQLTNIVRKLFKLGPVDPILGYCNYKNPKIKGEMSQIFQTLDYYSIEDGDEIFFHL